MITVKITFEDGNTIVTGINATLEEAQKYYLWNYFNFGIEEDLMVKAVRVEEV